jgi:hypothetical protein
MDDVAKKFYDNQDKRLLKKVVTEIKAKYF